MSSPDLPVDVALAGDLLSAAAQLSRWASRHADLGLPVAQVRTLSLLEELGPARVTALAEADQVSQPTMTAVLQRLQALGLAARTTDPVDARASLVDLTEAGRAVLVSARHSRARALTAALRASPVNTAELAAAAEVLTHLLASTTASLERTP